MLTIKNNGKKVGLLLHFYLHTMIENAVLAGEWKEEPLKQKKR